MFFNCNWCRCSCHRKPENTCCKDDCRKGLDNKFDKNDCKQERKCCHIDSKDYGYDCKNDYGSQYYKYYDFQNNERFIDHDKDYYQNNELDCQQNFNYYDQYGSFDKYEKNENGCKFSYKKDKYECDRPCKPLDDQKCYCKPTKFVCFPICKD